MVSTSYTTREEVEVYRFSWAVTVAAPLIALFLQGFIPVRLQFVRALDLPLLVTIYFAVSRRNPISGMLTGCLIGLAQDALTQHPIGVNGIAKTIVGYLASSLGVKIDVEQPGSRFLLTFIFYLVHQAIYFGIMRGLANEPVNWSWTHLLIGGLLSALLAIVAFIFLDRFKQRV
jgi:rod shape-determining protein MreD